MDEQKYVVVLYENEYWFLDMSPRKFKEKKKKYENPVVEIYQTTLDLKNSEDENREKLKTVVSQAHLFQLELMSKNEKEFDEKLSPILRELLAGYNLINCGSIDSLILWECILVGARAITKLSSEKEKILFFKAIYFLREIAIRNKNEWIIASLV